MKSDLSLYLFGFDATKSESVVLVDELDGNDGSIGFKWRGFADEGVGAAADCGGDDAEGEVRWEGLSLHLGGDHHVYCGLLERTCVELG